MSRRFRWALSGLLLVVASVLLAAGVMALYVDYTVLDENRFAYTTARALHEPAARREVGRALGDAAVQADPDLIAGRAGIETATETLLETSLLDPVVREAAVELHRTLLSPDPDDVLLDLGDARALVSSFVGQRFGLHFAVAGSAPAPIFGIDADGLAARATRAAHDVRLAIWLAPLALALLALGVAVAPDRRQVLPRAGLAVAGSGLLLLAVDAAVRHVVPQQFAEREAIAQALGVFLGPFFWWALATLGIGAVVALATSRFADLPAADRLVVVVAHAVARTPARLGWKVVHALAGVALGLALLVAPLTVLEVGAVGIGFLLVVDGLVELARLAGGSSAADPAVRRRTHRRWLAAVVVAAPLVLAVPAVALAVTRPSAPAVEDRACNGARALCHRPLDRVAFPAAHNAMSSANASFTDPNQRRTIVQQLDAGIRGLLIDSKEARATNRTSIASTVLEGKARTEALAKLGSSGTVELQDLLRRAVTRPTGPVEPYLCHIVCELGATKMVLALRDVRGWLDRNPDEVIVIVIEDLVTPQRTEQVFRASGLFDHVYTHRPGKRFPTLRELIDADERVLVMAEVHGFPDGWYPPGYASLLKETPYDNPTIAALRSDDSCRPNRGRESNPLFLINHWVAVYPPRPSKALVGNQRGFLLDRVRRCERIRQAFANLIAVDFASIGDVVGVARTVNGLPPHEPG